MTISAPAWDISLWISSAETSCLQLCPSLAWPGSAGTIRLYGLLTCAQCPARSGKKRWAHLASCVRESPFLPAGLRRVGGGNTSCLYFPHPHKSVLLVQRATHRGKKDLTLSSISATRKLVLGQTNIPSRLCCRNKLLPDLSLISMS